MFPSENEYLLWNTQKYELRNSETCLFQIEIETNRLRFQRKNNSSGDVKWPTMAYLSSPLFFSQFRSWVTFFIVRRNTVRRWRWRNLFNKSTLSSSVVGKSCRRFTDLLTENFVLIRSVIAGNVLRDSLCSLVSCGMFRRTCSVAYQSLRAVVT